MTMIRFLALLVVLALLIAVPATVVASTTVTQDQQTVPSIRDPTIHLASTAVDPGGGTSIVGNHTTLVTIMLTFALDEEGLGTVPRYPLIKPIAASGNLLNGFDVDDRSQVSIGAIASFTPAMTIANNTISLATAAPINPY